MNVSFSVKVKNSVENAFQYCYDFSNYHNWIDVVSSAEIIDQKEGQLGTVVREKFSFLGIPLNITYAVLEYTANKSFTVKSEDAPFYGGRNFLVEELTDGYVRVTLEVFFTIAGPLKLIPKFLLRKQIENTFQPFLENYKAQMDLS